MVSIEDLLDQGVVGSGIEPGSGNDAARLAGNRLIDHLAVDRAHAFGVLCED